jgi:hypothetical protein
VDQGNRAGDGRRAETVVHNYPDPRDGICPHGSLSAEPDREKRKQLVWEIERRLAEDGARPIIFYPRGGTCSQPYVKGLTTMVNSIYNGYRMEDVWLDK